LHLSPGEEARVRVGGAGSAGYQWTWTVDGDAEAVGVSVEPAPSSCSTPVSSASPGSGLRSGSVDQVVVVRGVRAGRARLQLALVRSFQPGRAPLIRHSIDVTVGDRGAC
jgi:hypothetical protein